MQTALAQAIDIITSNVHPHKYEAKPLEAVLRDKITPTNFTNQAGEYTDGQKFTWESVQRLNGLWHGRGCAKYEDGTTIEAYFLRGKAEGEYIEKYESGAKRVSNCINGKREGLVCQTNANGDIFYEQWKDDKRNGHSMFVSNSGNSMGLREWKDGTKVSEKDFDIRQNK